MAGGVNCPMRIYKNSGTFPRVPFFLLILWMRADPSAIIPKKEKLMQRIVQTLELVDTPEAIAEYCRIHENIWPEIADGIRSVGIDRMDIYLYGNTAVMIVETADSTDFDAAMSRLATLPHQTEWEEFVGKYQKCEPGSTSAGKWKRMSRIFELPS